MDLGPNTMPLIELLGDGTVLRFRRRWWQPGFYLYCGTKGEFMIVSSGSAAAYTMNRDDILANDWLEAEAIPAALANK